MSTPWRPARPVCGSRDRGQAVFCMRFFLVFLTLATTVDRVGFGGRPAPLRVSGSVSALAPPWGWRLCWVSGEKSAAGTVGAPHQGSTCPNCCALSENIADLAVSVGLCRSPATTVPLVLTALAKITPVILVCCAAVALLVLPGPRLPPFVTVGVFRFFLFILQWASDFFSSFFFSLCLPLPPVLPFLYSQFMHALPHCPFSPPSRLSWFRIF